jgi:hypothetical protein
MPDAMVIQLIYNVIFWLNVPIWENGASGEYSPREIVTGFKVATSRSIAGLFGAHTLRLVLIPTKPIVWMPKQPHASIWGLPVMSKGLSNASIWRPRMSLDDVPSRSYLCPTNLPRG